MQTQDLGYSKEKSKMVPPAAISLMTELLPHLQNLAFILATADVNELNLSLGTLGTFHWRADFKQEGICPSRIQEPGFA